MAFLKTPAARYLALAVLGLSVLGTATANSASRNVYNDIKTFNRILANVYDKYVDEVDSEELIDASIRGMMDSLDPHSSFLEKKQYEDLMFDTQGKYGGVGISIDIRDEWLTVVSPIEGTPAFKLGIQAGDRIIAIEGETTKGITTSEAAQKLRGRKGTPVTITIARKGEPKPFDVEIVREVIEIKSVQYGDIIRDDIAFVRLTRFSEESGEEVERALRHVVEKGAKGIVFDLRWNSGGLLTQAVSVSDKFLERGKLISYTQGRHRSDRSEYHATENPAIPSDIPVVVLVNGSTASASEIVSGALQDDGRAVILGELTYGKGLVQTLIPLDAEANLKLTTARWYTPSGRCIQKDFDEDREHETADAPAESPEITEKGELGETPRATGGIQPDIVLEGDRRSWYAFELERGNHFFRFAVDYTTEHPEVPRDFHADESVIEDFRKYLEEQDFDYESVAERELETLRELADEESYGSGTYAALDALDASLDSEKDQDFEKNHDYIRLAIEREIMSKMFGEAGTWEAVLRYDTQAQAAFDLLLDRDAYAEALAGKEAIVAVGEPGSEG
jgi:carboxyl-terminal processing protease